MIGKSNKTDAVGGKTITRIARLHIIPRFLSALVGGNNSARRMKPGPNDAQRRSICGPSARAAAALFMAAAASLVGAPVQAGPTTYTVTSTNDDNAAAACTGSAPNLLCGTLRDAVQADGSTANSIVFKSGVTGVITFGGSITLPLNYTLSTSGPITLTGAPLAGAGGLSLAGGALTLLGTNTYSGGTTINGGTLGVTADAGLGAAAGTLTFNGGTFQYGAGFTSARGLILGSNGGAVDTQTYTSSLGAATGTGGLTKTGSGMLNLTGSSNYSGATTISAGTLQFTNAGAAKPILTGNVADNGALVFNTTAAASLAAASVTVSGAISGSGSLATKGISYAATPNYYGVTYPSVLPTATGPILGLYAAIGVTSGTAVAPSREYGTTVLTGANTYTGGTTINDSVLVVGNGGASGSIVGDVVDNGTLVFDRSDTVTFGGVISGYGELVQTGSGTLILTGANTYGSTVGGNIHFFGTNVDGGKLQLGPGGSLPSQAVLTVSGGAIYTAQTATGEFDLNGHSQTISALKGDAWGLVNLDSGALTINSPQTTASAAAAAGNTYYGAISGAGVLTLAAGYQTLAGPDSHIGATVINSGATLTIANDQNAATTNNSVVDNGNLIFNMPVTEFSPNIPQVKQVTTQVAVCGANSCILKNVTSTVVAYPTSPCVATTNNGPATFCTLPSDNITIAGLISGTGAVSYTSYHFDCASATGNDPLVVFGCQTLPIVTISVTGNNTYSGGTTIANSLGWSLPPYAVTETGVIVRVTSDANLGAPTGQLTLADRGTLEAAGSFSSQRPVMLQGESSIIVDPGQVVTLNGNITSSLGHQLTSLGALVSSDFLGPLHVGGTGTLILTGNNSFGGGITIADFTTLQVSSFANLGTTGRPYCAAPQCAGIIVYPAIVLGGTLSATGSFTIPGSVLLATNIAVDPTARATINVASGATLTIASGIGGGTTVNTNVNLYYGFDKTGPGALVLGPDAYAAYAKPNNSQPIRLLQGTIGLSDSRGLGNGQLLMSAGTTLQAAAAGLNLTNAIALSGPDTVDTQAYGLTIAGVITDNVNGSMTALGQLVKVGSGTLTLSGANTYGGGTVINAGTLQVANDGNLGAASGGLTLAGGTLAATGTFTSTRPVTLTSGATSGIDVAANQTLTLSGSISGSGGLVKTDSGKLVITGADTSTGLIEIAAGTLSTGQTVGGVTTSATIAGSVQIDAGATLRGTGTILGKVINKGGTIAAGNSPGTLTFGGPLDLSGGGALEADIDGVGTGTGAGNYSRLILQGAGATLTAGGTIDPLLRGITGSANNTYTPPVGQMFNFNHTDAGVIGSFTGITQPSDGLLAGTQFDAVYTATDVNLVVTPVSYANTAPFGGVDTSNRQSLGHALDAYRLAPGIRMQGDQNLVLTALYGLSAPAIGPAMDQVSATVHADTLYVAQGLGQQGDNAVYERLQQLRRGETDGRALWGKVLGAWSSIEGDGNAAGFTTQSGGIAFGADTQLGGASRGGVSLDYLQANVRAHDGGGARIDHWGGDAYLTGKGGGWTYTLLLAAGSDQVTTTRAINIGGLARVAAAKAHGWSFTQEATLQHDLAGIGLGGVTPFADVSGRQAHRSEFAETGAGDLSLNVASAGLNTPRVTIGSDFDGSGLFKDPTHSLRLDLRLAWLHDMRQVDGISTAALRGAPGSNFTTYASHLPHDGAQAKLAVSRHSGSIDWFAAFTAEARPRAASQNATAGLRIAF